MEGFGQQQQQQTIQNRIPPLGWMAGTAAIVLFGVGVLKWMWQQEINHALRINPL